MKIKKEITVKELAELKGVVKRVAAGWIEQGRFPGARKVAGSFGQDYWLIPMKEAKAFEPQKRRGKPHDPSASASAVARRGRRSVAV
jgi:hypothetical protein